MCGDIEMACRELLLKHHDSGEDSVGARIEIDHLGPTMVGQTITVIATVTELALPRVTFDVEVRDEIDQVGKARHVRFVVDTRKQGERLRRKADRVKAAAAD
jgi:predicted thioesterase